MGGRTAVTGPHTTENAVEEFLQRGGFTYSASLAYRIARCVAVYPSPSFVEAVRKFVTPHVVRAGREYRIMEELLGSGCLTAKEVCRIPYHSPLFSKMVLKDVEFTTLWILNNYQRE